MTAPAMPCPRCHGSGRVPLPQSAQAVLDCLDEEVPALALPIAHRLGLSHQHTDGRLALLEQAGLARRLARGPDGYEWVRSDGR